MTSHTCTCTYNVLHVNQLTFVSQLLEHNFICNITLSYGIVHRNINLFGFVLTVGVIIMLLCCTIGYVRLWYVTAAL